MSSRSVWDLHPLLRERIAALAQAADGDGWELLITCTYRSAAEQDKLYAQGRTESGRIVTNLRGGESKHNHEEPPGTPCSLACDCAPMVGGKVDWNPRTEPRWQRMGEFGEQCGLVWGGNFRRLRDMPHFELAPADVARWVALQEMTAMAQEQYLYPDL